ncbi:hypothetical protein [Tenacibaculum sp. IB213877]|uniref:hypothetical protein n=1 Tax=Tenacibaculum sp. IB213877 TaxID=3097351 RepID=UPI002A59F995|nr:hypothetical protein [Tenacibaculum sp. IB213877]MDY0780812.1 hypothetical protein [Tenacibaculum sp. IB213877]
MKKQILNLGKTLNKKEQKEILGGNYKTKEECDAAGCFWGQDGITGEWYCTCPPIFL